MLIDYLDQVSVIHLPGRTDRFDLMAAELAAVHLPLSHPKVDIPHAPIVDDADGFPSRGVRGNFLSHVEILRSARDRDVEAVMVLEDDAIFRRVLRQPAVQDRIVDTLRRERWDLCFLGHPLIRELAGQPRGLIPCDIPFKWAHCYLVHRRSLADLVAYLEHTMENQAGDPRGGRLYIDGALSLFRGFNPEKVTLVANPSLSVQRGSPSSLGDRKPYDSIAMMAPLIAYARRARDELWRRSPTGFAKQV